MYTLSRARTFDPVKNERSIHTRGLSCDEAANLDFETAQVYADARRDCGETRHVAIGRLNARVHVLCFAETTDGMRVISFRKANAREVTRYEEAQASD